MEDQEYTIDLLELYAIVMANLKTVAKVAAGFLGVAVLYLLIAPPVYESESLLRITQPQGLGTSLLEASVGGANLRQMNTYAEILKSRSVVIPVIEATEPQGKNGKYPAYEGYVQGRITTSPFKDTDILSVKMKANEPGKAQKANQLLLQTFLLRMTDMSRVSQTATKNFLQTRADAAKADLDKTETALQQYKIDNKILTPSDSAKLFLDRITSAEKEAATNRINLGVAQAKLNATNSILGGSASYTAENQMVQAYKSQLAKLESERISYLDKYTEKHPRMIELNDQIAELKAKIREEARKVANLQEPSSNAVHQRLVAEKFQSEGELIVAQQKAALLQQVIDENNRDLELLPAVEKGYIKVARDAQVAAELYVMLAKRLEESKVAEVMVPTDVQIVDEPTFPVTPVAPRKGLTLAIAALLGVLAGCGVVIAHELMNRTIRTEDDVKNYLDIPVLGSIPDEESIALAMNRQKEAEVKTPNFISKVRRKVEKYLWKK